jgi:hypothetical protein
MAYLSRCCNLSHALLAVTSAHSTCSAALLCAGAGLPEAGGGLPPGQAGLRRGEPESHVSIPNLIAHSNCTTHAHLLLPPLLLHLQARFKRVAEAYQVLADDTARAAYHTYGLDQGSADVAPPGVCTRVCCPMCRAFVA